MRVSTWVCVHPDARLRVVGVQKQRMLWDCRRLAPTKAFMPFCELGLGRRADVSVVQCDSHFPISTLRQDKYTLATVHVG